jgi:hypothetical protein
VISKLWQRSWVQISTVALASGLVTGAVALELRSAPKPPAEPPGLRSLSAKGPSAEVTFSRLERRFRVFRTASRPADRVRVATPESPAGDVDAGYVRDNGMDVSLGRRLRSSPRVFAVPGRGSVCLIFERAGGECTPAAVAHRSFQVHTCGHTRRGSYDLSGLVADGVDAVFLRLAGGDRIRLGISRSFVDVTRSSRSRAELPTAVELVGPRGTQRVKVPRVTLESLACEGPG